MRVTNSMMMTDMMFNISANQRQMARYFNRLSRGGKQMYRPSDDPVGVSRVIKYTADINVLNQFKASVNAADAYNDVTESAVTSVNEILKRIRDLAVAGADQSKTPEDIEKYKIEIDSLKDELLILGNSTNGAKYVFSGLETDQKLFNKDGTYVIDMTTERVEKKEVVGYEITVGEVMKVGTHPIDLFGIEEDEIKNKIYKMIPAGKSGTNEYDANAYGGMTLTDQAMKEAKGFYTFSIAHTPAGGAAKKEQIEVNLNDISTVEEFKNSLQTAIDAKFPPLPAGDKIVTVTAKDGENLKLSAAAGDEVEVFASAFNESTRPLADIFPFKDTEMTKGTAAAVTMSTKIEGADYTNDAISVDVVVDGGAVQTFTVDVDALGGTYQNAVTKERFVSALENAETPGGEKLKNYANIYYNTDNQLVIEHKKAGSDNTIQVKYTPDPALPGGADGNITNISDVNIVSGTDSGEVVYQGSVITEDDIAAMKNHVRSMDGFVEGDPATHKKYGVVFTYELENGDTKTERIDIDFAAINPTADADNDGNPDGYIVGLKNQLQTKLNEKFDGKLTADIHVDAGTGAQNISITATEGSLKVDTVVSRKSKMITDIENLSKALENADYEAVNKHIAVMDKNIEKTLSVLGNVGGKTVRLKYIENRVAENTITFTDIMSELKYANMAELITKFKEMENVYRASLSVGSKVVQPSLVDFVR